MGAGKSKLGKGLARGLDLPFFDTDREVELSAGCPVTQIFERFGEPAFRQAEADTSGDVDIVYSLTREWGREGIELEILDIAPSALRRPLEYPR